MHNIQWLHKVTLLLKTLIAIAVPINAALSLWVLVIPPTSQLLISMDVGEFLVLATGQIVGLPPMADIGIVVDDEGRPQLFAQRGIHPLGILGEGKAKLREAVVYMYIPVCLQIGHTYQVRRLDGVSLALVTIVDYDIDSGSCRLRVTIFD